mgnify:CR=1 FL=1
MNSKNKFLFLGFKLDKTGEDLMKTPNKIPNATVYGNYEVKLMCDDNVINDIKISCIIIFFI